MVRARQRILAICALLEPVLLTTVENTSDTHYSVTLLTEVGGPGIDVTFFGMSRTLSLRNLVVGHFGTFQFRTERGGVKESENAAKWKCLWRLILNSH